MEEARRQRPPFVMIEHRIIEDSSVSVYGFRVYAVLCRFADSQNRCFPALSTIAEKTGISRRQVVRAIDELEALGYIDRKARTIAGKHARTSNLYVIRQQYDYDSAPKGGDSQALASDCEAQPSDSQSLGVVPDRHGGGDCEAHELEPLNYNHLNKRGSTQHPTLSVPMNRTRYDNLCEHYGQALVDDYIQRVIDWGDATGKRTKDYAARAGTWLKRDEQEGKLHAARASPTPDDPIQDFSHLRSEYGN